jgi:hypothetical protein
MLSNTSKFPILYIIREQMALSEDGNFYPHQEALKLLRKEVFDRFMV